ncbi:MAG: S1C family serine protease [Treponema sp.]|nr:serine protease [Treponema sp.]MCR5623259.1 S1C family serine protease [Treponema sp.]
MFRKFSISIGLLLLCGLVVSSCASSSNDPRDGVDTSSKKYTSEDAASYEIAQIKKIPDGELVKALWRSKLLLDANPTLASVQNLYSSYETKVVSLYNKAVSQKAWLEALRFYNSLEAVGYGGLASLRMQRSELEVAVRQGVPGLSSSGSSFSSLAGCVKGTVTVYVDKGVKVQGRVGYNDSVLGSGFFIDRAGYIITNHHVIADCVDPEYKGFARLYIYLAEDPDTRVPARIIGYDENVDLALLKTEVDAPYVFTLGSSANLDVGDKVYAIGSPLGLDRTLTSGIISSKDRELFSAGKVFQIDAAVNSGNSGGPLIDSKGDVQAVVFAGVQNYQGLNFAIPVEYLRYELPIFFSKGKRKSVWIGCYGRTKRRAGSGAANEGLSVEYVMPSSPAAKAGISAGDTIVEVAGEPVNSLDDLKADFMGRELGTIVRVKALDQYGKAKTYLVYLDGRPKSPGKEVYAHDVIAESLVPLLGMELSRASSLNRNQYVISRIVRGSIADSSGFSVDDTISVQEVELDPSGDYATIQIYAKKRNSGYLDVVVGYTVPLDNQYYF